MGTGYLVSFIVQLEDQRTWKRHQYDLGRRSQPANTHETIENTWELEVMLPSSDPS